VDLENDLVGPACLTHGGEVRNDRVRDALGLSPLAPPAPPEEPSASDPEPAEGAS